MTRPRAALVLDLSLDEFLHQAAERGLDALDYDVDDFRREQTQTPDDRS